MHKWAIINDWHVPYHDKRKVHLWLKIMREWQPDSVDINGDFGDFKSVSRWVAGEPAEHADRVAKSESTACNSLLDEIDELGADDKVFRDGNHEARLDDYLNKNAPALIDTINVPTLFDLKNRGYEYKKYSEAPDERHGGFYVHHGTLTSGVSREVSKYGVSMIVGHSHRLASTRTTTLTGRLDGFEGGNMTDLSKMNYEPHFDWQHGFLYGYYDSNNAWIFEAEFKDNTVVVDGRTFKG